MPPPPETGFNWENYIGQKLFLWVGAVALFLMVAYLLDLTWVKLGPVGRLSIGILCGAAMLIGGEMARGRVDRVFSEGLIGGGLAIFYLDAWAATAGYKLLDLQLALPLLVAVTVFGVFMAVRHDAVSLSALSTLGGSLTPALVPQASGGPETPLPFLSYVAVLNAGILAVSLFKRWRAITWLSFIGTILLLAGWGADHYHVADRWTVFNFITLYFLLFAGASCFYSLLRREVTAPEDLLLLFADALVYFGMGYALTKGAMGDYPCLFPLCLALLFGVLALATRILAPDDETLLLSEMGLAVFYLTLAFPIQQLKQGSLAIAWSVEAAVLLTIAARFGSELMRRAGQVVWLLAVVTIWVMLMTPERLTPRVLINEHGLPLLMAVLSTAWVAVYLRLAGNREDEIHGIYSAAVVLGGAWLIGQETAFGFQQNLIPWPATWAGSTLYVMAILLSVFALAMFAAGLKLKDAVWRSAALGVGAVATVMPMWRSIEGVQPDLTPFWNPRWLAFVICAASVGVMGWMTAQEREDLTEPESDITRHFQLVVHILILWAMSAEILASFLHSGLPGAMIQAQMTVAAFWCVYAAFLTALGWMGRNLELRWLAYIAGFSGALLLVGTALSTTDALYMPVVNLRFLAFAMVAGSFTMAAALMGRNTDEAESYETGLPATAGVVAAVALLWGLTQEVYGTCHLYAGDLGIAWQAWAGFAITILWSVAAAALAVFSVTRQKAEMRGLAAVVATGAVVVLLSISLSSVDLYLRPIANIRFLAFLVAFAASAFAYHAFFSLEDNADASYAMPMFNVAAAVVLLWGLTQEVVSTCGYMMASLGVQWGNVAASLVAMLWAIAAAALVSFGWGRERPEIRGLGYVAAAGAALVMAVNAILTVDYAYLPVVNPRFLAFAAVTTSFALIAHVTAHNASEGDFDEGLAPSAAGAAILAALWGLTQETYSACMYNREALGENWQLWAQAGISVVWSLMAAGLLIGGIATRNRATRLSALFLMSVTVVKVFVFDIPSLGLQYRVFSLGGAGLALIGISWLYNRYIVHEETPPPHTPANA